MIRRSISAIGSVVALLAVVALLLAPAASGHGLYDWTNPTATASDGHYVVSLTWNVTIPPEGYGAGDLIWGITCLWSDGSVDDCGEIADWL